MYERNITPAQFAMMNIHCSQTKGYAINYYKIEGLCGIVCLLGTSAVHESAQGVHLLHARLRIGGGPGEGCLQQGQCDEQGTGARPAGV